MKTHTLDQQPAVGVHASACPAVSELQASPSLSALFNAPNPGDTALVPQNTTATTSNSGTLLPMAGMPMPGRARNGKIARLPKPIRDLVNRMLFNNVSQERIVGALDEIGINVTQRNISNWKTHGGYREWCLAQNHAIALHNHQDNLIDLIRRHDANELPEVGLQAAATQLSQFFLTPAASQLLAANPKEYERRVSMLSRISGQLGAIQKHRDECAKNLGHSPARIRKETSGELEKLRQNYTSDIGECAKDPIIPHRNELPPRDELFHVPPPEPPRLTMEAQRGSQGRAIRSGFIPGATISRRSGC